MWSQRSALTTCCALLSAAGDRQLLPVDVSSQGVKGVKHADQNELMPKSRFRLPFGSDLFDSLEAVLGARLFQSFVILDGRHLDFRDGQNGHVY